MAIRIDINSTIITKLLIILAFLGMTACGKSDQVEDLKHYMEEMKQTAAASQKKIPPAEFNIPTPQKYSATTALRSPFDESGFAAGSGINAANPLQAYPLSVLRFVGTLTQGDKVYAFILAPDNAVYQVQKGDVVGERQGHVVDIYPDRINIMEVDTSDEKAPVTRMATIQLKDAP